MIVSTYSPVSGFNGTAPAILWFTMTNLTASTQNSVHNSLSYVASLASQALAWTGGHPRNPVSLYGLYDLLDSHPEFGSFTFGTFSEEVSEVWNDGLHGLPGGTDCADMADCVQVSL